MVSIVSELAVALIAQDAQFLAAMTRDAAAMEGLARKSVESNSKMSAGMKAMGLAATVAVVGILTESTHLAANFQEHMTRVSTLANAGQQEVAKLSPAILKMAGELGATPVQLADMLYHFESVGIRGSAAMDAVAAATKLANESGADYEQTATALAGVATTGMKDVKDMGDAAAYVSTIVGTGNMKLQDFVDALGTGVLPIVKGVGLGMTDFGAALATATDLGEPAVQFATRLRTTLMLAENPTQKATKALEGMGMSTHELADDMRKPNGLVTMLTDLQTHMNTLSPIKAQQALADIFGGARTGANIELLLQQLPRIQQKIGAIGTESSRAAKQQEAWKETQATLNQQLRQLHGAADAAAITLGTKLLPIVTKVVEWFNQHRQVTKLLAEVIGVILIAVVIAYTVAMIRAAAATVAASWEILVIVAVIAIIIIAVYELVKHWKFVWAWIKQIAGEAWHWIYNTSMDIWNAIKGFFLGAWHALADAWNDTWSAIKNFFLGIWHGLEDAWQATWNVMKGVVGWIYSNIIKPIIDYYMFWFHVFEAIFHGMQVVVNWAFVNVFKPIAMFVWDYLLYPFRVVLTIVIFLFKVAWAFMAAVLQTFWAEVKVIIGYLVEGWQWLVRQIKTILDIWVAAIKFVIGYIVEGFNWLVSQLKMIFDIWVAALKFVWDWIYNTFWVSFLSPLIHTIEQGFDWLVKQIKHYFDLWVQGMKDLWNAAVGVWHDIYNGFISPAENAVKTMVYSVVNPAWDAMKQGLHVLSDVWGSVWGAIKGVISGAWSVIKGIIDAITGAIHDVMQGLRTVQSTINSLNPSNIGKSIAGFFGFGGSHAEGGFVPGGTGKPMLTLLHGGEFVLTAAQVDALKSTPFTSIGPSPVAVAGAGVGGGGVQQIIVMVDGKQLFDIMVQRSQRNKIRNNSTFLT